MGSLGTQDSLRVIPVTHDHVALAVASSHNLERTTCVLYATTWMVTVGELGIATAPLVASVNSCTTLARTARVLKSICVVSSHGFSGPYPPTPMNGREGLTAGSKRSWEEIRMAISKHTASAVSGMIASFKWTDHVDWGKLPFAGKGPWQNDA